jgi:hypothetical protein
LGVTEEFKRRFPAVRDLNQNPGTATAVAIGPDIKQVRAPGANVEAILYRLKWLELMHDMSKREELTL